MRQTTSTRLPGFDRLHRTWRSAGGLDESKISGLRRGVIAPCTAASTRSF